ncbi:metallophosphoesterase family protein [Myxococcus xanthus]|uniref:Metallophosphoesterase n=1 Tax=Myxococcus xanthus TaxID=34 RepID=A0A7Y4MT25_MYXXA|nr:metallophosphoesterase [Myxococcus xanthus]NOJ81179.1 metallophosphoesterase [Myxococcus xanthus]NOJ89405.1 metallophosphoesterase [Myxococcus xanthus]
MEGPLWLNAMPEIRSAKTEAQNAANMFAEALLALNVELRKEATKDALDELFGRAHAAWSTLINRTENLSGLGLSLATSYPEQAKYLVAGTTIELLENILAAAEALAAHGEGADPLEHVRGQPRVLEASQRLISITFPDSSPLLKTKFESLGLPTTGFTTTGSTTTNKTPTLHSVVPPDDATDYIKILHISDLHRTSDEKVSNPEVLNDLLTAIRTFNDGPFDLIVLSGDVTQEATEDEFKEAEQFLDDLAIKLMKGVRERIIVVPGNHDINWKASSAGNFKLIRGNVPNDGRQRPGLVVVPNGYILPTEEAAQQAISNFRDSYHRFYKKIYPSTAQERFQFIEPKDLPIGILALDTIIGMHHFSDTPHVDRTALIDGLQRAQSTNKRFIAVGHHGPIRLRNQHDGVEGWCLERLLDGQAAMYLHGHVHETQISHFSRDGIVGIPCIGVGSLVAGPRQRPESTARQYHVIQFPLRGRRGRVLVRRKDQRDRAWQKDTRFGPATSPVDHLDFHV